jgi:hypothetical protein
LCRCYSERDTYHYCMHSVVALYQRYVINTFNSWNVVVTLRGYLSHCYSKQDLHHYCTLARTRSWPISTVTVTNTFNSWNVVVRLRSNLSHSSTQKAMELFGGVGMTMEVPWRNTLEKVGCRFGVTRKTKWRTVSVWTDPDTYTNKRD